MEKQFVCPWWLGYLLIIPIRKFSHNPNKILSPHIKPGMNIMDYGSAMGYFSLPMARMTGEKGKVYCVDIQKKMLDKLKERADNAGLGNIIKLCQVNNGFNSDELRDQIDFTLLFYVAHEVPDNKELFNDLFKMTKKGGKVMFVEPKGHVKRENFEKSLQYAKDAGFKIMDEKPMQKGMCAFLIK